jgi:hypothetical protein
LAKAKERVTRKLPLPLQVKLGDDTVVTDGFFFLTKREAEQINIIAIGQDGYATIEILPSSQNTAPDIAVSIGKDTFLGTMASKSRGLGKEFGQYKYFKRVDGSLYALTSGKRSRKIELGNPTDIHSKIFIIASAIGSKFGVSEFTKKDLIRVLPSHLSYGQILKAILDAMTIEGYVEKREKKIGGRLREMFKVTPKLRHLVPTSQFRIGLNSVKSTA